MILLLLIMAWANLDATVLHERLLTGQLSRNDFVVFSRFTSPEPSDYLNPRKSRFVVKKHHAYIAQQLTRIRTGEINRLEIELPPRHGKSELSVRKFVPWYTGWFPDRSVIVVTHTDDLARDHGRDVRGYYAHVSLSDCFPKQTCAAPGRYSSGGFATVARWLADQIQRSGRFGRWRWGGFDDFR